jgi:pimeloyl-ACP methyl ester carboxylesterase
MLAARDESRGLQDSATEAAAVEDFGDLPLIVLTGRLHTDPPDWQAWQAELLQLSPDSQQLFAEHAGHGVQIDQPEAAEAAILQMVRQVRQTAQK